MFAHTVRTCVALLGLCVVFLQPLEAAELALPAEMFAWGVLLRADSTIVDSTKKILGPLGIGDPTNTDLPYFYPSTLLNRRGLTRPQQPDRYSSAPKGFSQLGSIDSTLSTIRLYELMEGVDVGTITPMSLDEYFKLRREQILQKLRDSSLAKYELKKPLSEAELTKLLDQATNITIPLPQSALFSSIFGKPEISITVNGEVNVTAGWRWDSQALGTASIVGQSQSAPVFNQNIQVNVSGRIGDKFKMNVDWNTLNQFEFNNRFKVGFDGYDDDIIKKVEFGNVNLETQSSLIGGGQTLFGIRADFQFGPLFLKTIASQRRAERRFINARGGASRQQFSIRAYDYARNHFFLDTAYFAVWRAYHKSVTPVLPIEGASLVVKGDIEVWESTTDLKEVQASEAVAIADLQPINYAQGQRYDPALRNQEIKAGIAERGRFVRLDPKRYEVDLNLGTLTVLNIRNDRYYAVSYRTEGPTTDNADDQYYGTLTTNANERDTLILKLIARPQMQPGFKTLWKRMMRNRYNIGVPNINPQEAKIGMWYYRQTNDSTDVLEGAPDKIMTIFRIDQVNNGTGVPPADGQFDARQPVFNSQRGEITFPSLEPFRDGLREYFAAKGNAQLAEQYVFNEVYDTTEIAARLVSAKDRFLIVGEAMGTMTGSRIPLAYQLSPGSVRVTLDGMQLREGVDYTVDYYTGTLSLLNQRASLPNANLNIEYEQNDIFNLTTRTLLGMRADMLLLNKRRVTSSVGMTLMNYDQAAIVDRVLPGQEPNANLMFGFDAKLNAELPWLTRALNSLPFIDTKEKSTFAINGEWAMVSPTPNKRVSTVASDMLKSVAYVDDFESARRYLSFGLTPTLWLHSSAAKDSTLWQDDTTASLYRGKMFWYQRFVPDVPQLDVYPNRANVQGRNNINPVRITFIPDERGIYNANPEFVDNQNPTWNGPDSNAVREQAQRFQRDNRQKVWGGMMRLLSPFNTNFDNENIDFIEVMMRIDGFEPGSKMYIDLGQISEDVIPNQRLNTEDQPPANNLIDEGEDLGIDNLDNAGEKLVYPFPLSEESDPARDDYQFNFAGDRQNQSEDQFRRYNNFEGNATQSEMGQFPDTEILNRNNGQTISLDNSYFRYEVNLNPNPATNPQIVGGNPATGWYQFRIPVRRPDTVVGNPLFTNVQYARIHFQGGVVKVAIADWGLVGSFWLRNHQFQPSVEQTDTVLQVAYVNREENQDAPDYYTMPPGVTPPQQLQNPDPYQQLYLNEQSLVVRSRNLRAGEERFAARIFRPWDLFYYKEVAFFIHGDNTMPSTVTPGSVPPAYCFVRFGVDSANYYEYRRPLLRGWQDLRIKIADITALKETRDRSRTDQRQEFPVPGDPDASFAIKGNPIMTRVSFFGFGLANPKERFPNELSTTMWVDELRVVDPTADNDWAAIGNATLKLADIGEITSAVNHSTPNFHRLEERYGNRVQSTTWTTTVQVGAEKLLPKAMKETRIPISYTHAEISETPQFQAQNDVELDAAANAASSDTLRKGATPEVAQQVAQQVRQRSQRVRVQDQWALNGVRLGIPVKAWYIDDIFNKLTFNFSYAQEFERSQVVQHKFDWRWRFKVDYALTLPGKLSFQPWTWIGNTWGLRAYKDTKINLLPQTINASLNMTRARITEQSRFLLQPSPIIREFMADKMFGFNWRLVENSLLSPVLDYKVASMSTLVPFELDENGRQRSASQLSSQIFNPGGGLLNLGAVSNYNQTITLSFKPRLPDVFGLNKLLETTGSYNVVYNLVDPLQTDLAQRDVVREGKYTSNFRLSPVWKWRQFGNEIFGAPAKGDSSVGRVIQDIFFGFENFTFTLNQSTNAVNRGILGESGFSNLWGRSLLFRDNITANGPNTAYQLGLIPDPHGELKMVSSPTFPFFRFETGPGVRPANAVMQDDYAQKSNFQFQTNRTLWPGATLDLTMKTDLGFSRNQRLQTDAFGVPTFSNVNKRQTLDRTFVSFSSLPFGLSDDNVETVVRLYNERKTVIEATSDTATRSAQLLEALSTSFREGFESWQFFSGELGRVLPGVNWTFRWDGLEKFPLFKGLAQRVFLEHGYQSTYTENARINDNGRFIEVQQVKSGFSPLVGVNLSFDERKLEGVLTATGRYSVTNTHGFNASARSVISLETSHEFQLQASYLRRAVPLKLFGMDLKNDLEITLNTQVRRNRRAQYDILDYKGPGGAVVDGTTQVVIEPRAKYTISNRVTASAFVKYEGNFSEGAANPGFSTTQVGLDIRLSISGGR